MHGFLGIDGFGGKKTKAAPALDVPIEKLTLAKVLPEGAVRSYNDVEEEGEEEDE